MVGIKENLSPTWKKLMKLVDLGEPTSFFDHVYLECTQRECKSNENIKEHKKMFESIISAERDQVYDACLRDILVRSRCCHPVRHSFLVGCGASSCTHIWPFG